MECYLLWTADAWLMRHSFELHGIFSTAEKAIVYVKQHQLKVVYNHVLIERSCIDESTPSFARVFSTQKDEDLFRLKFFPI